MNTTVPSAGVIALIIGGVLACSALVGFAAWRLVKTAECAERDVQLLRRMFVKRAIFWSVLAIVGIALVLTGGEPPFSLIGLPAVALLMWTNLRAALISKPTS